MKGKKKLPTSKRLANSIHRVFLMKKTLSLRYNRRTSSDPVFFSSKKNNKMNVVKRHINQIPIFLIMFADWLAVCSQMHQTLEDFCELYMKMKFLRRLSTRGDGTLSILGTIVIQLVIVMSYHCHRKWRVLAQVRRFKQSRCCPHAHCACQTGVKKLRYNALWPSSEHVGRMQQYILVKLTS